MPTYDYRCNACKHEFELFQSIKAKPEKKCPACGKNSLERLIGTGAALLFKGSGFYQTDYRSDSYKKSAEADAKPAKTDSANSNDAGKSPTATGDSKPATSASPPASTTAPHTSSTSEPKPSSKEGVKPASNDRSRSAKRTTKKS